MSLRRLGAAAITAIGVFAVMATMAFAHPLGNFSVNRYSRVEVGPERTTLRYVLDLAEIPALQELQAAGLAADAVQRDAERGILARRAAAIAASADLSVGDRRAAWDVHEASIALSEGQAGLRTMRIALMLVAALPARAGENVSYRDGNEPGRSGWHEIVLRGVDGVDLANATAPSHDTSDELRRYPADPTVAPPDMDRAVATVVIGAAAASTGDTAPTAIAARLGVDPSVDGITAFVRRGAAGDHIALALAVAVAASLGAVHALTPGHGKTIMAAFLVGTRGGRSRALVLGLAVAASHTFGVFVLAALVLGASTLVPPERLYPVLSGVSAIIVVAIGARLLRVWARDRAHARDHLHGHEHVHRRSGPGGAGWRSLVALGVSGGLVPSASALLILLAAVAVRRPDLGLLLVAAFGCGMASVLVGLGIALVGVRDAASRRPALVPVARRFGAYVPLATAIVVTVSGVVLSAQAIAGLVPL